MKNTWKRETTKDFTAWDLNCRHCVPHTKSHNQLERKLKRKNRRKVKNALDKYLKQCYN